MPTGIEWTDETWNPIAGCSLESPGCTNCYAMKMAARLEAMKQELYRGLTQPSKAGPVWTGELRPAADAQFFKPLEWKKPRRIFVNSMSDLFHPAVPDEVIDKVFAVMALTPWHTYQILTKRAARMFEYMTKPNAPDDERRDRIALAALDIRDATADPKTEMFRFTETECFVQPDRWPLPNVWLGVSVEDRQRAAERLPFLFATPAAKRIVSFEPALECINLESVHLPQHKLYLNALTGYYSVAQPCGIREALQRLGTLPAVSNGQKVDQVILGGESGPHARARNIAAYAELTRNQCAKTGTAFFFKQYGDWLTFPAKSPCIRRVAGEIVSAVVDGRTYMGDQIEALPDGFIAVRVGKKAAGNHLDGVQHMEFPK